MNETERHAGARTFALSLLLFADGLFVATLLLIYWRIRGGLPSWPDVGAPAPPLFACLAGAACVLAAAISRYAKSPLLPAGMMMGAFALTLPLYLEAIPREGRYGMILLLFSLLLMLHQVGGAAGALLGAARGRSLKEMHFLRRYLLFVAGFAVAAVVSVFLA